MITIELRHNPFKAATTLSINGKETHLNCLGTGEGHRMEDWKDSFFPELVRKCNLGPGSGCSVYYYGLTEDFENLQKACATFFEIEKEIEIKLTYNSKPLVSLAIIGKNLQSLVGKLEEECPFTESLKNIPDLGDCGTVEKINNTIASLEMLIADINPRKKMEKQLAQKKLELENICTTISELEKQEDDRMQSVVQEVENVVLEERNALLDSLDSLVLENQDDFLKDISAAIEETVFVRKKGKGFSAGVPCLSDQPAFYLYTRWEVSDKSESVIAEDINFYNLIKEILLKGSGELKGAVNSSNSIPKVNFSIKDFEVMFSRGFRSVCGEFCELFQAEMDNEYGKLLPSIGVNVKKQIEKYLVLCRLHIFNLVFNGCYYGGDDIARLVRSSIPGTPDEILEQFIAGVQELEPSKNLLSKCTTISRDL